MDNPRTAARRSPREEFVRGLNLEIPEADSRCNGGISGGNLYAERTPVNLRSLCRPHCSVLPGFEVDPASSGGRLRESLASLPRPEDSTQGSNRRLSTWTENQ
jgi:hypothetical protein